MLYNVFFGEHVVGTAEVAVNGLYWHIQSQCILITNEIYKLAAVSELGYVDIGIFVPKDSQLILEKNIPIKRIGKELRQFTMHRNKNNTILVPLCRDKPFEYISMLETTKLVHESNGVKLLISVDDHS